MISGFSVEGAPQLYLTDPAGTYSSWKVNLIGDLFGSFVIVAVASGKCDWWTQ